MDLKIVTLKGKDICHYIKDLARFRIDIFREYPYLYDGNVGNPQVLKYEMEYLDVYVRSPESIMILAMDDGRVVGASTAIPMSHENEDCQKPFIDAGMNLKDVFYLGESVLEKAYRGQGIYRKFFNGREEAAKKYGAKIATFCAVERPENHPKRPQDYLSNEAKWEHFGYKKDYNLNVLFDWKEIDEESATSKTMIFWLKTLV